MSIISVSTLFTTSKIEETQKFYSDYFDAKIVINTGSYLILKLGNFELHFMTLESGFNEYSNFKNFASPESIVYNVLVENSREKYDFFKDKNLEIFPFQKMKFGDEGFLIKDPNGINLFVYSEPKK